MKLITMKKKVKNLRLTMTIMIIQKRIIMEQKKIRIEKIMKKSWPSRAADKTLVKRKIIASMRKWLP